MEQNNNPVFRTKTVSEVPFKSELYSLDCSFNLIKAVGPKSYRKFIRDCDDPELLFEVLMLKRNQAHFPDLKKIIQIQKTGTAISVLIRFISGKTRQKQFMCAWLRSYIPKTQYPETDFVKLNQPA